MRRVCIPAGIVREARFCEPPSFIGKPTKSTGARRTGQVYENKAQEYIKRELEKDVTNIFELEIIRSPWIAFASEGDQPGTVRYCQPDCLLVDKKNFKLTAIEIKLQHCYEAYTQLRKLYEPVLRFMFPEFAFAAVELVQWHEPHVVFPEKYYHEEKLVDAEPGRIAIHIWNPRYDPVRKLKVKK